LVLPSAELNSPAYLWSGRNEVKRGCDAKLQTSLCKTVSNKIKQNQTPNQTRTKLVILQQNNFLDFRLMSKLSDQDKFLDVSDYGRPIAVFFANLLKNTWVTPVQVTFLFGVCGLFAIYCILNEYFLAAGFFLILKSIIDAIDGELSRAKNMPSYTGRYLDSVFDVFLNFGFLVAIASIAEASWMAMLLAFFCIQLQCTLYNYYYVILRNNTAGGDTTSNIFEVKKPTAFPYENQKTVNILFYSYVLLYGLFDHIIYFLDYEAHKATSFPNHFMTALSCYGLGFQLLLMAIMLAFGLVTYIIPFFIVYSVFLFIFIIIRRNNWLSI
jgi:phosphatidylglycerophosphate synthase